jgi:serine/threonine-protein kinase RsbW
MTKVRSHSLSLSTPPDDLDTVHRMLEGVWSASTDVPALDRVAFETALIELAANVLRHADDGSGVTCALEVLVSGDRIEATLTDSGTPGNVRLVGRAMPDEDAESGRGIPIIQALVDDLDYARVGGLNRWRITRSIQGG